MATQQMILLKPDEPNYRGITAITRFLSHIKISKDNTCWEWTGTKTHDGYGQISFNGKTIPTHRFIYEYMYGTIPAELQLDHLCRNRACANHKHLEAVSHQENMLRGISFASINHQKTHCPQGHEYILANTYHTPAGGRRCRICVREASRRYKLKQQKQENTSFENKINVNGVYQ